MFENWWKLVSSNKIDLVHEKITYYITKTRWEVFSYNVYAVLLHQYVCWYIASEKTHKCIYWCSLLHNASILHQCICKRIPICTPAYHANGIYWCPLNVHDSVKSLRTVCGRECRRTLPKQSARQAMAEIPTFLWCRMDFWTLFSNKAWCRKTSDVTHYFAELK